MSEEIEIYTYTFEDDSDESPFDDWMRRLTGQQKAWVHARITRVRTGNFGDWKPIKGNVRGLYELRIQKGPGFRI